jgi:tRNA pseudouridine38-40 synthase
LPPAIRVLSAEEVHADFHPRFQAKAKTYEYRILRGETCSPFEWPYVYHYPYPLDEERMRQMALAFAGEHDFTAYAASDQSDAKSDAPSDAGRGAEVKSKVRTIFASSLRRDGERLIYQVRGSGFLKHMVRNLVGTLIEAGRGNIADVTAMPGRCGSTAPAKGLFLVSVEYD